MQELTRLQLQEVRQALFEQISLGLASPGQQVACLPAYLTPPPRDLEGQALVVDAGGTNLRCAWVELGPGRQRIVAGPLLSALPDGRTVAVDAAGFFAHQAQQLRRLGAPEGLALGYCFSYPAEVEPDGDARLLNWTKGIQVTGVVGQRVGQALRAALGQPGPVKVLNDTVAALLGASLSPKADQFIGLIAGTGTNMAAFLPRRRITKLGGDPLRDLPPPDVLRGGDPLRDLPPMAVNLESGNFHPPHLTEVDEELDRCSAVPGQSRYEKAISGYYLPKLLALMCPELGIDAEASTQVVVEHAPSHWQARWLLDRSADLVAAGLAAVIDHLPSGCVAIQAEGGLFWKAPGYARRVEQQLSDLLGSERTFSILKTDEVNLFGAAAAALS